MPKVVARLLLSAICLGLLAGLAGCASTMRDGAPNFKVDFDKIPNAVPVPEPLSKYGNPPSYVVNGHRYYVLKSSLGYNQTGIASWYGTMFYKRRTSSGEPYNMLAMTAASKVLPLPTFVQVTNLANGKQVIVKVNDRGPFRDNRIIDLSYVAAGKLGMLPKGTALVEVKAIDPYNPQAVLGNKTPPPQLGHPQIYLQLGAFAVYNNAARLQSEVKRYTQYPVLIETSSKNGRPLYRVQIGPVPDVDSTDNLHDLIEKEGLGEPITVIR